MPAKAGLSFESGRQDLNLRPPGPQPGALPDCATPRDEDSLTLESIRSRCEHVFVSDGTPPLRRCGRCDLEKPLEALAWRRIHKGQRDNYCRPCRAAYKQEHYQANKQRYIDNAAVRRNVVALQRWERLLE